MKFSKFLILISLAVFISCKSAQEISGEKLHKKIVLVSTDFQQKENAIPFYIDKWRKVVAINAGKHKNKFSSAEHIFNGKKGRYNIILTTLKETDGESTYRIFIDDKLIKEVQNPETEKDFEAHIFTLEKIKIKKGATLEIQFNSHSNGKIPENDGFAFSRGRWKQIEFIPVK